ncbi:MAG TPA: response regulator, partial [Desulfurivibrionaceae bacterium]|nr:response regulator [Desulfurivibrionaceae bacterium]
MSETAILIVDDDKVTRKTLSMALEDDYTTVCAASGREALDILDREEIDLILSDLDMPGMTGLQLLEKLNQRESPPVIFITGQGTIETAVQAMKLGAYDYVSKPVN